MTDESGTVRCNDCGIEYSTLGLDLVLPYEQWSVICPEDGILCANCICQRAAMDPQSTVIQAWIDRMDYSGRTKW